MSDVTINSVVVISSGDLDDYEDTLSASDLAATKIIDKNALVERYLQRRLAAEGIEEDELSDATELRDLAAYQWLYRYYSDRDRGSVQQEGFGVKADRYRDDRDEEAAMLFGPPVTLTLMDDAVTTEIPKKFRLLRIG